MISAVNINIYIFIYLFIFMHTSHILSASLGYIWIKEEAIF